MLIVGLQVLVPLRLVRARVIYVRVASNSMRVLVLRLLRLLHVFADGFVGGRVRDVYRKLFIHANYLRIYNINGISGSQF